MLAFLNTSTFPVFIPPTYFNPAFILRFYLYFIFYLAFIYCVLLFTNIIYHVMRTDTCNKPHTLRDAVTGRNTPSKKPTSCRALQGSVGTRLFTGYSSPLGDIIRMQDLNYQRPRCCLY